MKKRNEEPEPYGRGRCVWEDKGGRVEGANREGRLWKETQWASFFIEVEGRKREKRKRAGKITFADRSNVRGRWNKMGDGRKN